MKITDLEPYRPQIDRFDLTEEQKIELVEAIAEVANKILDRHFSELALCYQHGKKRKTCKCASEHYHKTS